MVTFALQSACLDTPFYAHMHIAVHTLQRAFRTWQRVPCLMAAEQRLPCRNRQLSGTKP